MIAEEQLPEYITAKRRIAAAYAEGLGSVPGVRCMAESPRVESAFWLYTVLIDENIYGLGSRDLVARFQQHGIQARRLWQPLHVSPAHRSRRPEHCPVQLHAQALSLPSSAALSAADQACVVNLVTSAVRTGQPRPL